MTIEEFEKMIDEFRVWNSERARAGKGYDMPVVSIGIGMIYDIAPAHDLMVDNKIISQSWSFAKLFDDLARIMRQRMEEK
jgi:hypothetical protein